MRERVHHNSLLLSFCVSPWRCTIVFAWCTLVNEIQFNYYECQGNSVIVDVCIRTSLEIYTIFWSCVLICCCCCCAQANIIDFELCLNRLTFSIFDRDKCSTCSHKFSIWYCSYKLLEFLLVLLWRCTTTLSRGCTQPILSIFLIWKS